MTSIPKDSSQETLVSMLEDLCSIYDKVKVYTDSKSVRAYLAVQYLNWQEKWNLTRSTSMDLMGDDRSRQFVIQFAGLLSTYKEFEHRHPEEMIPLAEFILDNIEFMKFRDKSPMYKSDDTKWPMDRSCD